MLLEKRQPELHLDKKQPNSNGIVFDIDRAIWKSKKKTAESLIQFIRNPNPTNLNRGCSSDFQSVYGELLHRKSFTRAWFLCFWPKADHRRLLWWQADLRMEEKRVKYKKYGPEGPYFPYHPRPSSTSSVRFHVNFQFFNFHFYKGTHSGGCWESIPTRRAFLLRSAL